MQRNPSPTFDHLSRQLFVFLILVVTLSSESPALADAPLEVQLRLQRPASGDANAFMVATRDEKWTAAETAIVVCDVWDYHHSPNAVARLQQLLPSLDAVLKSARSKGVTIIHAPSDCMDAYQDHPGSTSRNRCPPVQRINQPTLNHGAPRFPQKKRPPIRLISQTEVKTTTARRCMPNGQRN